ncbi:unnamed protein product [Rodentolepis nana]|uniref:Dynein regulatory complex protein 10 n=1 Tax=Rodentolepis nana TaxID=102285 RepID=A0A0R3TNA9_RODNA|nr:unnamed protein product [Rodentolepis nana]
MNRPEIIDFIQSHGKANVFMGNELDCSPSEKRALDQQTESLQSRYAELSEVFNDSIHQINTRGIEDYEKTVSASKVVQEQLKAGLASTKDRKDELLPAIEKELKDSRRKKYKLESQLETQIAAYDKEMLALQEEYEQMLKKYDEENLQLEDYKSRIVVLRPEYEKVLAESVTETEQQKALETGDTVVTKATSPIATYNSTAAAPTKRKAKGRGRR